ncbi:MAG: hypothetical protein ACR2KL_10705 [Nocardioidaceae bacterium]
MVIGVREAPLDYPWWDARWPRRGVLGGSSAPVVSQPPVGAVREDRLAVVAIGSNAAPQVLWRKLVGSGVDPTVPFEPCTVEGMGVGHSAHVSPGGYIAAAPHRLVTSTASIGRTLLWLTVEQVAAVDATEPNYHRTVLDLPVRLGRGALADVAAKRAQVYVSHWGVLGRGGVPLPLLSQPDLLRRLASPLLPEPEALAHSLSITAVRQALTEELQLRWRLDAGF